METKIISKRGKTYKIFNEDIITHNLLLDSIINGMKISLKSNSNKVEIRNKLKPAYEFICLLINKFHDIKVTEEELNGVQLTNFPAHGYYKIEVYINKPEFHQTIILKMSSIKEGCFAIKKCNQRLRVVGKTLEDQIKELDYI